MQGILTSGCVLLQEEIEKCARHLDRLCCFLLQEGKLHQASRGKYDRAVIFLSCKIFRSAQGMMAGCCCLVQEEIEKYRGENVTADSERHRELSQLEERLSETQEQAAWYQHKHQAAVKRVDQLKVHIHSHTHSRADPAPQAPSCCEAC